MGSSQICALGMRTEGEYVGRVRVVLQRVSEASVTVSGEVTGAIGRGLLLLVGIAPDDDEARSLWMARKVVGLRVFEDEPGKMNLSLLEVGGEILAVSQFTLFGSVRKGRRPSFQAAGPPEMASPAFDAFCDHLRAEGAKVATGVFGAAMEVRLLNDGPVTLVIDHP